MGPKDGKVWRIAALAGLLCGCGAFSQQRKPRPPEDSIDIEGEGSGPDAAAAGLAARKDALGRALQLFLSTAAPALSPEALEGAAVFLGEGEKVGSGQRGGLQVRRERFAVRYRALRADLDRRGLLHPGAIAGGPRLLLDLEPPPAAGAANGPPPPQAGTANGPSPSTAAEILRERLDEAGFETVLSASEHPEAEARRQGARVLVQGRAEAAAPSAAPLGRLVSQEASYDLTAAWIPAESTAPAAVLPGHVRESAQAYELAAPDAAARAADNAAIAVAGRLRVGLADRLDERFRMTVLVLSLGDLAQVRKFLAAVRTVPRVDAAALDVVAGADARFHVWARRMSADELAMRLKSLSGFHFIVRNVESPYGWVELDTEDAY